MSTTKRSLQLSAAMSGIIFSLIFIVGAIVSIYNATLPDAAVEYDITMFIVVNSGIILFSLLSLIVCAMVCKPADGTNHFVMSLMALVFLSMIAVVYLLYGSLWVFMPLVVLGLFVATLSMPQERTA